MQNLYHYYIIYIIPLLNEYLLNFIIINLLMTQKNISFENFIILEIIQYDIINFSCYIDRRKIMFFHIFFITSLDASEE